jgi:putative transposase
MDRWVSGSLCRKNMAQSPSNVALVHKTANILDKMPKSVQGKAKQLIHEMYLAPIGKEALAAFDQFLSSYQVKFPKACECLEKDKEVLFTFYDFLAQHWPHLRTTNPIESTFATVRLRTHRTKGCGSRIATLTMIFKLGLEAQSIGADSRASN